MVASVGPAVSGCAALRQTAPSCGSSLRLALVAQSVPAAAYVPCLNPLPTGWTVSGFQVSSGQTHFSLHSSLAPGQPVVVRLLPGCDVTDSTASSPRAPGVSTYIRLVSIDPRYAGTLSDVFPGGCVTYAFSFRRGPHIGLIENFESAVTLYPRQQLVIDLHRRLGLTLGS